MVMEQSIDVSSERGEMRIEMRLLVITNQFFSLNTPCPTVHLILCTCDIFQLWNGWTNHDEILPGENMDPLVWY